VPCACTCDGPVARSTSALPAKAAREDVIMTIAYERWSERSVCGFVCDQKTDRYADESSSVRAELQMLANVAG
jgi:hypothetical protein